MQRIKNNEFGYLGNPNVKRDGVETEFSKEEIRELTGEYIDDLDGLSENIALIRPDPEEIDSWTELSIKQNLDVSAANFALEIARKEMEKEEMIVCWRWGGQK